MIKTNPIQTNPLNINFSQLKSKKNSKNIRFAGSNPSNQASKAAKQGGWTAGKIIGLVLGLGTLIMGTYTVKKVFDYPSSNMKKCASCLDHNCENCAVKCGQKVNIKT